MWIILSSDLDDNGRREIKDNNTLEGNIYLRFIVTLNFLGKFYRLKKSRLRKRCQKEEEVEDAGAKWEVNGPKIQRRWEQEESVADVAG